MKESICTFIGFVGAWIAAAFGGWSASLSTLIILMAEDYITGLVVAGVFHKSPKTDQGGLNSNVGWMGLAKKVMVLLFVLVAHRLDLVLGVSYAKDAVCIAYIVNELLSLIENAGLMGVPIPDAIKSAIEVLQRKDEKK